ncbi:MAG TPA: glycosyltransferase [Candidatus Bathyarchaeia archaeon]|nr:glycosyltransferase [Candidatus Bathyarchaeia archaeon]
MAEISRDALAGAEPERRITLIGGYPPPYGGNSAHLERLADRLLLDGHALAVIDPYSAMIAVASAGRRLAVAPPPHGRLRGWLRLVGAMRGHAPGSVVHVHMSAGGRFYRVAPVLLGATRGAVKRILTVHSGSFERELEALDGWNRRLALAALGAFDDVICVNPRQRELLRPLVRSRLHVIPAYLPVSRAAGRELPDPLRRLREAVDLLVVTSGYGTAIYDYATVVRAVELAQSRLRARLGLVVATYATWNADSWTRTVASLERTSVPAIATTDLDPEQFLLLLAQARIYVRATLTDGDAVAIREAASLGVQVLASDAVARPPGSALFATRSADELALLIVRAAEDRDVGRLPPDAFADHYASIRSIYLAG